MIKINLIPYKEKKQKADRRRAIAAGSIVTGIYCLILVLLAFHMNTTIAGLEEDVAEARERLKHLTSITGDLEKFKRDKVLVEKKIGIIDSLEKNRLYPVHILNELAERVPPGHIWLTALAEAGGNLRVEGIAGDNPDVAAFMSNLERSPYVNAVDLISSKQTTISGRKFMSFILSCRMEKG